MSCVTCHVSYVMCNISCILFFKTKWWKYSVKGLLLMGPIPSSFYLLKTAVVMDKENIKFCIFCPISYKCKQEMKLIKLYWTVSGSKNI